MMTEKLKRWIDAHPETDHPLDTDRWYNAIYLYFENENEVDFSELEQYIREQKDWENEFVEEFIERKSNEYSLLKDFYKFLKKK